MYEKYQTEALVLYSREHGEADRMYMLYTRDFGLVRARASAVRLESSKMRHALQDCALVSVGLVHGAHGWRVAGTNVLRGSYGISERALRVYGRLARLLERLVVSEERHEYLFEMLSEAHGALCASTETEWPSIELLSVARMLYTLGYLAVESIPRTLLVDVGYTHSCLAHVEIQRQVFLTSVNKAILETHL